MKEIYKVIKQIVVIMHHRWTTRCTGAERLMDSSKIMQEEPYLRTMVLCCICKITVSLPSNRRRINKLFTTTATKNKFWLILYIRFTSRVQFQNYTPYKLIIHS